MVFRGSLANLFVASKDEQFVFLRNVVFLSDMGVHSLGYKSRNRIAKAADDETVSRRERRVHACELFSRSEGDSDARGPC